MRTFLRHSAALIALATGLAAGTAQAQDAAAQEDTTSAEGAGDRQDSAAPARRDNEIVVTAQKSGAQVLQDVPLAIQAFDGEALKEKNIQDLEGLISAIPGAYEGQNQSVASRSYNVRGVGGSNANGDSPIGYYIDDVPFFVPNFGIAPPIRFIDIERVEVLRGPQGTLYGQGSSGGVFIFHTRDPNLNDIEFSAEGMLSSTRGASGLNYELAGAVSVPIIDDVLGVRVSGGFMESKGWADEYFGAFDGTPDLEDRNKVKNDDIRAVVLFKPTANTSLRAQYWRFRPRQKGLGMLQSIEPPYFAGTGGQANFADGDFSLYSLTGNIQFDNFELTSATTYLEGEFGINIPIQAGANNPAGNFRSYFLPQSFTQEVRANSMGAGPLHWLVGMQYQDSEGPQENAVSFLPFNFNNNTIVQSWAAFGEVSYELFDGKLIPLVGVRQYWEDRTFANDTTTGDPQKTSVTTWRLNLSYLPTDDLTLFATVATGFRPGIILSQAQATALELDGIPAELLLDPETVTNYEIGGRWQSPGRSLRLGLNVYRIEIEGQQTGIGTTSGIGGFVNLGDARTQGIDFELAWDTPLDGLTLSAVGNVNDGEYTFVRPEVQAGLPNIVVGGRLVNSVEFNYRLDANYRVDITDDLQGFANASVGHTGNRASPFNTLVEPYELVNAIIGVRKDPFELSVFANNLLDERGPINVGFAPTGGISATPRTIGARLRVTYR